MVIDVQELLRESAQAIGFHVTFGGKTDRGSIFLNFMKLKNDYTRYNAVVHIIKKNGKNGFEVCYINREQRPINEFGIIKPILPEDIADEAKIQEFLSNFAFE